MPPEDVGHLDDFVPSPVVRRPDLNQGDFPSDAGLLVKDLHRLDPQQPPALGGKLVYHQLVRQQLDGDAGGVRAVRGPGDDGLDVIALPGEEPGHLAEDAGGVLRQNAEGVELLFRVPLLSHDSPPSLSRKSVISDPEATMGRTISSMSSRQSITAGSFAARASARAFSMSAAVSTRKPRTPYASASFTKSGPRSRVVSE